MGLLEELVEKIKGADDKTREQIEREVAELGQRLLWVPNPGPQTQAYFCKADILLYGGEAGGGKSDLGLGLAFNEHYRSLIMRRQYTDLSGLTERALEINGTRRGFSGSTPPKLRSRNGKLIEFGAAKEIGDEASWQGRPHDLLYFDEGVQFAGSQVRFLITWLRSVKEGQRVRCVIGSNPPVNEDGIWLTDFFAPWLDPSYPEPAEQGELRWFIIDPDNDQSIAVDGPGPVEHKGHTLTPMSRTFIRARVTDNPFLREDYRAALDSLPEPYRSAFRDGNFLAARQDDLAQVIPTAWIQEAMNRWRPIPPTGVPMCAIGVDVAAGGKAFTVLAPRFDGWFAKLKKIPGTKTPTWKETVGLIIAERQDNALIIVDLGGGWGGEVYGALRGNEIPAEGWMGVEKTNERTNDTRVGFANKRSLGYWRFREALDPAQPGGSPIELPPDPRLMADLAAPRFEITSRGITVEPKDDVIDRLGRSPDDGDAVVMSWTGGQKQAMQRGGWQEQGRSRKPQVNTGSFKRLGAAR